MTLSHRSKIMCIGFIETVYLIKIKTLSHRWLFQFVFPPITNRALVLLFKLSIVGARWLPYVLSLITVVSVLKKCPNSDAVRWTFHRNALLNFTPSSHLPYLYQMSASLFIMARSFYGLPSRLEILSMAVLAWLNFGSIIMVSLYFKICLESDIVDIVVREELVSISVPLPGIEMKIRNLRNWIEIIRVLTPVCASNIKGLHRWQHLRTRRKPKRRSKQCDVAMNPDSRSILIRSCSSDRDWQKVTINCWTVIYWIFFYYRLNCSSNSDLPFELPSWIFSTWSL